MQCDTDRSGIIKIKHINVKEESAIINNMFLGKENCSPIEQYEDCKVKSKLEEEPFKCFKTDSKNYLYNMDEVHKYMQQERKIESYKSSPCDTNAYRKTLKCHNGSEHHILRVYTGQKPYIYNYYKKPYTPKSYFHIREKPNGIDVCKKCYNTNARLKEYACHTDEMQFYCGLCKKLS